MKLSRLGEFGLIDRIRRRTPVGRGTRIGIGDDAAWIENPTGSSLVTADLLVEGVHFNLRWISLFDLGHKALAVNLSDIAAMGGIPAYVILSLGIPANFDSRQIDAFYRGFMALATDAGVTLVGGDTNVAKVLIVSVCVIGHAPYRPVRRSGAKIGDDIYITGAVGDSALALFILQRRRIGPKPPRLTTLLARHHRPTPRLSAGAELAKHRLASAMIDVSDGLVQDMGHICSASRIGATIWEESLPLSPAYQALAGKVGSRYALSGGEDYELLFCARTRHRRPIHDLADRLHLPMTRIGVCTPAKQGVVVMSGAGKPIAARTEGYDHFAKV
ncbi:MAG TPA: thiamine-phosphate kinase [Candidatus Binatia bacterium]|jgi:thiamine-monophosphate kinase